jgi:hypothetical protein
MRSRSYWLAPPGDMRGERIVMTHFLDADTPSSTLCGEPWETVIMNDRPPTCEACKDIHATTTQWVFPLPPVVV